MKKIYLISLSVLLLGATCAAPSLNNSNNQNVPGTVNTVTTVNTVETNGAEDISFTADTGIRMENASNAGVKFDQAGGITLLYENRAGGGNNIATATGDSDWLEFGSIQSRVNPDHFRAIQLPDGTWRAYGFDTTKGIEGTCLKSQSSSDGVNFTPDEGCRYELQPNDRGRMGVYDLFSDSKGGVVLLYIGDLMGVNNVRRAYSTDNGWTFAFDRGNVLGDDTAGGGGRSYVDQKTIKLSDGSIYLVAMQMGRIYAFLSTDDGMTFEAQGEILSPDDFTAQGIHSLHDPQIIQLPDGRLRIYLAGSQGTPEDTQWVIVSATSAPVI